MKNEHSAFEQVAREKLDALELTIARDGFLAPTIEQMVTLGDALRCDEAPSRKLRDFAVEASDELAERVLSALIAEAQAALTRWREARDLRALVLARDVAESCDVALGWMALGRGGLPDDFAGYAPWLEKLRWIEGTLGARLTRMRCQTLLGERAAMHSEVDWVSRVCGKVISFDRHILGREGVRAAAADAFGEIQLLSRPELDLSFRPDKRRLLLDVKAQLDPSVLPTLWLEGLEDDSSTSLVFRRVAYSPMSYEADLSPSMLSAAAVLEIALANETLELPLRKGDEDE